MYKVSLALFKFLSDSRYVVADAAFVEIPLIGIGIYRWDLNPNQPTGVTQIQCNLNGQSFRHEIYLLPAVICNTDERL